MSGLNAFWPKWFTWMDPLSRTQQIKDYVALANKVRWQRQGSFLVAAVLAGCYFNPVITLVCYLGVFFSDVLDLLMCAKAASWDVKNQKVAVRLMIWIAVNTVISAVTICTFIICIALQQPSGGHFTPLIFLFSASLFATMYNSQMMGILLLRLSIYGVTFLFIAFLDVLRYHPSLSSPIWLNLFTVFFVLYFMIDISLKFSQNYKEQLDRLRIIKEESEKAKIASEIKSQFISTVSHELRTPLTSIKGSLDLANSGLLGEVPEKLKRVLGIAVKNGQRLEKLVNDLLDVQKIEAGKMEFQLERLNVNELVKESIESATGYAEKLGIHVTTILPAREMFIQGDHSRLVQVMNNLLSNAFKFSNENGSVQVRVTSDGDHVRISVQDEGLGIPESARDRIFRSFSQVDSSDRRKVEGTGLGLNIAKQIVERHAGTIDYTSEHGVGSTFYIELPLSHVGIAELPPGDRAPRELPPSRNRAANGTG
ncbi:sensor histidine kinase [Acidimangrovimonas sediminis]|uniref:sensor histidine kinase n=1 Tax=Acidimangrovimonas sediminis TaxID=2056283 RepID=UPI000C801133|nr:HAMP domain-containing sensor histidine kinase [Acidimangrovimonas sediminis]